MYHCEFISFALVPLKTAKNFDHKLVDKNVLISDSDYEKGSFLYPEQSLSNIFKINM